MLHAAAGSIHENIFFRLHTLHRTSSARVPKAKLSVRPRAAAREELVGDDQVVPLVAQDDLQVGHASPHALSRALRRPQLHSKLHAAYLVYICSSRELEVKRSSSASQYSVDRRINTVEHGMHTKTNCPLDPLHER